jgi:hypothetical protein
MGHPQVHGAVDLAAPQLAAELLAQFVLEAAQVLGQAETGLEVAVVDAAQFAGELPETVMDLAAREAGHADDHEA